MAAALLSKDEYNVLIFAGQTLIIVALLSSCVVGLTSPASFFIQL